MYRAVWRADPVRMSEDLLPVLVRPLQWEESRVGDGGFLLPTGTVSLLLADVEGSTAGWEADPGRMTGAIAELNEPASMNIIARTIRMFGQRPGRIEYALIGAPPSR